ncbi:hypothetical protein BV326_05449 [Pseudomonas syringae pv. actinidiae]|uniref:hypothetical protein n=1 Tax=Pseudomonas syringae TaxID=317 RepID=UPI000A230B25|nr:hypothetical protein [Pseudomonas syringae]OSR65089.1 hypothetical protein BV326_05449 [Pseudomonas syringae pv. actinidiae]
MQDIKNGDDSDQDDPRFYCDVQMSLSQGQYLLELVNQLQGSMTHPTIDTVLRNMRLELETSIEIANRKPVSE